MLKQDKSISELIESFQFLVNEAKESKKWRSSLNQQLETIIKMIHQRNNEDFLDDFVPLDLALKKLGMSKRTLDAYRVKGEIGYIKVGRKLYFLKEDLQNFMTSKYIHKL